MSRAQVTVSLDIPDVRVLKTEINPRGELIISIESTKNSSENSHVSQDAGRSKEHESEPVA